jgi:hypothetical protein
MQAMRWWWSVALALATPTTIWAQTLSGYTQFDYVHSQESVDQLNDANGQPLNQDRFLIRRARIKLSDEWRWFEYVAELEVNSVSGFTVGPRQLEVAVVWPPHVAASAPAFGIDLGALGRAMTAAKPAEPAPAPEAAAPPADAGIEKAAQAAAASPEADGGTAEAEQAEAPTGAQAFPDGTAPDAQLQRTAGSPETPGPTTTGAVGAAQSPAPGAPKATEWPFSVRLGGGIFLAPFGYDVYELGHQDRLFAEPSMLAQGFFPGQFDVGVRLALRWRDFVCLTLAMQNGEPIGEQALPSRDPNAAKDFFGRVTARAQATRWLQIEGGLSTTGGYGFHPGTPATKDVLIWRDFNEDGIVQLTEIQAIRGSAATPSQNFGRWGVGADLRLRVALPPGELMLFGEAAIANNLDRGIRPADPVLLGRDQRSLAAFGGFTQEIGRYGLIGARVDYYASTLDQTLLQGGTLVRAAETFTNYSFAAAVRFAAPGHLGRGRLMVDYTFKRDPLGRDAAGKPADLKNDVLTVRMQLEL